jgi:hypothetical protein
MADPTAAEVAAAIATLQAFEHAREVATESPVLPAPAALESPFVLSESAVEPVVAAAPAPAAIDPYLARSVKSSPNGF